MRFRDEFTPELQYPISNVNLVQSVLDIDPLLYGGLNRLITNFNDKCRYVDWIYKI